MLLLQQWSLALQTLMEAVAVEWTYCFRETIWNLLMEVDLKLSVIAPQLFDNCFHNSFPSSAKNRGRCSAMTTLWWKCALSISRCWHQWNYWKFRNATVFSYSPGHVEKPSSRPAILKFLTFCPFLRCFHSFIAGVISLYATLLLHTVCGCICFHDFLLMDRIGCYQHLVWIPSQYVDSFPAKWIQYLFLPNCTFFYSLANY